MAYNWVPSGIVNGPSLGSALLDEDDSSETSSSSDDDHVAKADTTETVNTAVQVSPTSYSFPFEPATEFVVDASLYALAEKYEIQNTMAERLRVLQDFEIVVLCDDSGSMRTSVDGTDRACWDELRAIVKIVLEVGTMFDSNGVDLYFLNRRSFLNIKDSRDVDRAFSLRPSGFTPLAPALNYIFQLPTSRHGQDKMLLVFVATDGAPTDKDGNENIPELRRVMCENRRVESTYVTFLLCTDDPASINYLYEWDRNMENVDVIDHYRTEREQIHRYRGPNYPFSLGDYVVKTLIGAIDSEVDALDEL